MSAEGAITPEGLAALRAELEQLEGEGRRKIAERIKYAADLGDLKENAEYHIAKEDQAHLETRIVRLQARLRSARVVEVEAGGDVVVFGGTATVVDEESGSEATYTIVGPTEADMANGKLSAESPVAQALLGTAIDEIAVVETPRGARRLRVVRLS
jgi:transcription elongation factor GreA